MSNVYTAIERNCINSSKTNPARGTALGRAVSVISCDSSLGCPHEAPARGTSPPGTPQREQLELRALLAVPRCLRQAEVTSVPAQPYLRPAAHRPHTGGGSQGHFCHLTTNRADTTACDSCFQQHLTTTAP